MNKKPAEKKVIDANSLLPFSITDWIKNITSNLTGSSVGIMSTNVYHETSSIKNRIKHAGEVRRIKKSQRRRAHLRSLRS